MHYVIGYDTVNVFSIKWCTINKTTTKAANQSKCKVRGKNACHQATLTKTGYKLFLLIEINEVVNAEKR